MTDIETGAHSQLQDEERVREGEEVIYSPLYVELIHKIIKYIRSTHPASALLSAIDLRYLDWFGRFSLDAQRLFVCLLSRKDLKWHPIRRMERLRERLKLDPNRMAIVMSELCEVPSESDMRALAQDQSHMSIDEAVHCLVVRELHLLVGSSRGGKDGLIFALKQQPNALQRALSLLVKCIQISDLGGRLFRRLILIYYRWQSDIDRRHLKGAELAIFEGLGKRFKAFTPKVLSQQLRAEYSAFVSLELGLFPNTSTNLKLAAVDNYVPIFEDILEVDMDERVSEAYDVLSARACHVLCGLILQRHNFELRSMDCPDMFDSENVEELAAVITELCVSLCIDENRQEFSTVLKRLKVKDLQEIGKKHGMKPKNLKSELIKAFEKELQQPRLRMNSPSRPFKEQLMREIIEKLGKKRTLEINPELRETIESSVTKYFHRQTAAPAHISGKPFSFIRRRFLGESEEASDATQATEAPSQ